MSFKNIMPILKPRSEFYKKYGPIPVVKMLKDYGFIVDETPIDDEDIVHFEDHKKMIQERIGLSDVPFNVKKEFSAEYSLSAITSVFVEGRYTRTLTGEKMYGSYFYYFYKEGFLSSGRKVNGRIYADRVTRLTFLRTFEKQAIMFKKNELRSK
ncbi:hypothetical protein BCR24_06595 [Enterococcus ureilyticus]|uniref:Uncharacterized protein n=1 Tax=Enterococcus ureilyticus TaxID=1131292 RepID=A0A1E5H9A5_9ENTE|nr:hypothetical protein [Enterococcus ureilyticus]MBM7688437.1 hypothetical protein [Enterococcus ureilyticus]OEG21537.1 hypothetical protein BCR24_06595 [Enterococcus ureilyticus]